MSEIESKKNLLNLRIRETLYIIGMIDGIDGEYDDYKENTLNENDFLDSQIKLLNQAKERLINIFKD